MSPRNRDENYNVFSVYGHFITRKLISRQLITDIYDLTVNYDILQLHI